MANVPNSIKTLPKISIAWVGRTNVTDRRQTDRRQTDRRQTDRRQTDRQTDGRRHIANVNVSSRSLKMSFLSSQPRTKERTHKIKWNISCINIPIRSHILGNWLIVWFETMPRWCSEATQSASLPMTKTKTMMMMMLMVVVVVVVVISYDLIEYVERCKLRGVQENGNFAMGIGFPW